MRVEDDVHTYAVGETAMLFATMELVGPERCTDKNDCNGPSCTSEKMTPDITVLSLECTPGASCVVADTPKHGAVRIDVTSNVGGVVAGTLVLEALPGQVVTSKFDVRFAKPTGIVVSRPYPDSPEGDRFAVLPGTTLVRCPDLASNEKGPLTFTPARLVTDVRGPANAFARYGLPGCVRFMASKPGEIVVTHAFGDLVRTDKVVVVDPSDVVAHEVVEVPEGTFTTERMLAIEEDPLAEAGAPPRVVVRDCGRGSTSLWASRLRTRDGRVVLKVPDGLRVEPADLARATPPTESRKFPERAFFAIEGALRGDGEIVSDGFAPIPLTVAAACAPIRDGGADAATDSGDAGP